MRYCFDGTVKGYLACHSITNIFYIIRKEYTLAERADMIRLLCSELEVIGIDLQMILDALDSENLTDLEDSLQIQCAVHEKLDYIVTRNIMDFTHSEVENGISVRC